MKFSMTAAVIGLLASTPAMAGFDLVFGSGGGRPATVRTYQGGRVSGEIPAYPQFNGGVRVAVGDVTGDGVGDLITAAGAGGGPHVKVFNGATGAETRSFFAYDAGFSGGVNVTAGDLDGDGRAEVITGAGAGGGPHVKVFDGATGDTTASFFAFDAGFTGGTTVTTGDVSGDGTIDIIVGTSTGSSHIRAFDSATLAVTADFFAFDPSFTGGVSLATGRYFGTSSLFVGAGPGGAPTVKVFSLKDLSLIAEFLAFDPSFNGGVSLGAGRIGGRDSLVIGTASGGGRATLMDVSSRRVASRLAGGPLSEFEPFGSQYDGGLSVAAFAAVPEPLSWSLMIAGFGLCGAKLRRRSRLSAPATASA